MDSAVYANGSSASMVSHDDGLESIIEDGMNYLRAQSFSGERCRFYRC
jgi:hypothetical protein